jgi:hypothetical protein
MAEIPSQGEEGDLSLSEQHCLPLPLLQKVSTSAADLMLDEFDASASLSVNSERSRTVDPPPSPFTAEELTETNPTPQPQSNPVPEGKEPAETPEQEIKDAENPITDRISIPIVNRTAFGIGSFERTANATVIQPVLPIPLGENYLVVRPSIPFVYVPTIQQPQAPIPPDQDSTQKPQSPIQKPQGGTFGLGDVSMQVYFIPKPTGKLTWGIGPTFLFPTASDRTLGFGKWGIGPAVAAVWRGDRLTVGGRIENYWSVAGAGGRPNISQLSISVQAYWQPIRPGNSDGGALAVQFQSLFPR